jgi:uncharacterized protein (DUF736 family)
MYIYVTEQGNSFHRTGMGGSIGQVKPLAVGDRVRVVQQSASSAIKLRRYRVVKVNSRFDLLQLEWVDALPGSKERYLWVLADYVRSA